MLKRAGGRWQVVLSDFPDERGIRVGLASRSRLAEVEQVRAFPERIAPVQVDDRGTISAMGRGAVSARLARDDVVLVTCHLKSKLLNFQAASLHAARRGERARYAAYGLFRRAAEAATCAHVDAVVAARPVCVLGDLNDEPVAATTQLLLRPPGSEIGTPGFERPDKGDAARRWNLAPFIPEERRFRDAYRGRPRNLDHILVSQALVRAVVRVDLVGEPPSIGDDPESHRRADVRPRAPAGGVRGLRAMSERVRRRVIASEARAGRVLPGEHAARGRAPRDRRLGAQRRRRDGLGGVRGRGGRGRTDRGLRPRRSGACGGRPCRGRPRGARAAGSFRGLPSSPVASGTRGPACSEPRRSPVLCRPRAG